MNQYEAEAIAERLGLKPHPEGGRYIRTYRGDLDIPGHCLPPAFGAARPCSTAILYMLAAGEKSRLHRLRQDELWHFHLGGPLRLLSIDPEGMCHWTILGSDILNGNKVQHVMPAGHWFGAMPAQGCSWTLAGCTVAPGFDFADFELARPGQLENEFPHLAEVIREFQNP